MELYFLLPVLAFFSNLYLGLFILIRNLKNKLNQLYALFAVSCALWAIGDFFNFVSLETAVYSKYLTVTFSALSAAFFLHFVLYFTRDKMTDKKSVYLLYIPALFFIGINSTTDLVIKDTVSVWWGYTSVLGGLYHVLSFYIILLISIGIVLSYRFYHKTVHTREKQHTILLMIALFIPLSVGIITQFIFPLFNIMFIDIVTTSTIFSVIIIGYGILKFDFIHQMSFSYRKKITAVVIIVILICSASTLIPGFIFAHSAAIDVVFNNIQNDANIKSDFFTSYIEEKNQTALIISKSIIIQDFCSNQNNSFINSDVSLINSELSMIAKSYSDIDSIDLLDHHGFVRASSNQTIIGTDRSSESLFHDSLLNITFHDIHRYSQTGKFSFPVTKRIVHNNVTKAILLIHINPKKIFDYLTQNTYQTRYEESFLVNTDGVLISPTGNDNDTMYHTKIDTQNFKQALLHLNHSKQELEQFHSTIFIFNNHRNEKVIGTHRYIPQTEWFLLSELNYDDALSGISMMQQSFLFVIVILIVIGFFISYVTSKKLTKPIMDLRDATHEIGKGSLNTSIDVYSKDEVGDLAESFRSMVSKLKDSREEIQNYNKNLEKLVGERTSELQESQDKLKSYIEKLERNKIVLTKMMAEMKTTIEAKEKAEEELKQSHEMLQHLNKELEDKVQQRTKDVHRLLQQKDEFIHQLGHDLKNPMGPLINLLPVLEKKTKDEREQEIIKVLKRNVMYMKRLVTNTLELARLNSPKTELVKEPVSLKQELEYIVKSNKFLFEEKNMDVINNITDKLMVNADRLRLEELFTNLLNNAVKYSYEHGTIIIDAEEKDDQVQCSIQDTGIGMTDEQLGRLFDEFYKADESRHDFDSSGLGMPIAKRIVEKHGGHIWAESEGLGKGSTFFFTLPKR